MDNEEEKQKEGKGFAGLSSMVSDVDDVVASTQEKAQKTHSDPSPEQSASKSTQQAQKTATKPASQTSQAPGQPTGGSSGGKWLIGIAVVIGLIWLANQSDNNRPSRSTYSPASSTSTAPASQPSITQPQVPSRPSESKPSVGRNNVLSIAEIRYCLAEKIRLDAAETVLNSYSDSDVNRFNAYVNDYNSRCGEFRYRQGALESARRDINPYSSQLQAEGRGRFVRSPSTTARAPVTTTSPKPARPMPDATVLAIQRRLNELGYNAGTPDGLFGSKTRAAIQAFQKAIGISVDGMANTELLRRLNESREIYSEFSTKKSDQTEKSRIPANAWVSGSTWYCNEGYRKVGDSCEKLKVPVNAWVSGSTWYCNEGYRRVGDTCEKLKVPANAWVSGSTWYCNEGYRKVGDSCEKLKVPANAWVSGSTWYCNEGYRKVGDSCEKLKVPANAWVSGSTWYCNEGYRRVGDACEKLKVPANAWVSGSTWYCNDGFKRVGENCVSIFQQ